MTYQMRINYPYLIFNEKAEAGHKVSKIEESTIKF